MTEIEILGIDKGNFRCAFYYAVPAQVQIPDAADQSREPAGTRLTAQEIQDLKDGTLYELVRTVEVPDSFTPAQLGARLISNRTTMQSLAAEEYKMKYANLSFVGKAYDGTSWS